MTDISAKRTVSPNRMPRSRRAERGATLPELLIALLVSTAALGLIGTAVYQLFVTSAIGNARLTALHNLQNAALWLNRDAQQAEGFTPGSDPVYGVFTTGDPSIQFRYSYDAMEAALLRELLIDGASDRTLQVARGVQDQGDIVFSAIGSLLTISITTGDLDGQVTESMQLRSAMRVR